MKLTHTTQQILSALVADIQDDKPELADAITTLTGSLPVCETSLRHLTGLTADEWLSGYTNPTASEIVISAMQMADHMDEETPIVTVDETGTSWGEMPLREHLRRAGSVKSERKANSSRENGKTGGRPKIAC